MQVDQDWGDSMHNQKPNIFEANILYLILGFFLLFLGYLAQSREIYSGLLITEFILIFLPNIIFLKVRGYSLKYVLRLNRISFKQILYIFGIMIFSYPIAVFINAMFLAIINNFSSALPTTVPIPANTGEFILGFFVIAITPGICEEVMFRGTISKAYDNLGYRKSILISAILFGFFHFNIMNLVGPIFLGVILGILAHKANSIYASMLGHTLNNGIALSLGYLMTKLMPLIEESSSDELMMTDNIQFIISLLFFAIIAAVCLSILLILLRNFPESKVYDDSLYLGELTFGRDKYIFVKYIPIVVVFITFVILNFRLLFYV